MKREKPHTIDLDMGTAQGCGTGASTRAGAAWVPKWSEASSVRYSCRLTRAVSWSFEAKAGTEAWVERFARLLKLDRAEAVCARRVYFTLLPPFDWLGNAKSPEALELMCDPAGRFSVRFTSIRIYANTDMAICHLRRIHNDYRDFIAMWGCLRFLCFSFANTGALSLHGALIRNGGSAVAVLGGSGTENSGICRRVRPPWRPLSDDGLFVAPTNDGYSAFPLPTWSDLIARGLDKQWDIRTGTPLTTVYFLEQNPSTSVAAYGKRQTAAALTTSAAYYSSLDSGTGAIRSEHNKLLYKSASAMARNIPGFHLKLAPTGPVPLSQRQEEEKRVERRGRRERKSEERRGKENFRGGPF